jgi:hypothetical protein
LCLWLSNSAEKLEQNHAKSFSVYASEAEAQIYNYCQNLALEIQRICGARL